MAELCNGNIKLPKWVIKKGVKDSCAAFGSQICEDCGKLYCHNHINRDKHKCDDSVKGCHGTLK